MFFYSKLYTDITPRRHICLTHARCYFVIYQQFFFASIAALCTRALQNITSSSQKFN